MWNTGKAGVRSLIPAPAPGRSLGQNPKLQKPKGAGILFRRPCRFLRAAEKGRGTAKAKAARARLSPAQGIGAEQKPAGFLLERIARFFCGLPPAAEGRKKMRPNITRYAAFSKPGIAAAKEFLRRRFLPLAFLCSCLPAGCTPPVSFEYLDLSCSASWEERFYFEESVRIDFSIMPDKGETERALVLNEGGLSRVPVCTWEGRTLHVKPLTGWKKGEHYEISLEGKLPMEDGRVYSVQLLRGFIYGLEENEFTLRSSSMEEGCLVFIFSRAPGVTSFSTRFSLSPGAEYFCDFLGEEVRILPKSPWRANTLYSWTIRGMESADGYIMKKEYSGFFSGPENYPVPYPVELCPVNRSFDGPYLWKRGTDLDGKLENMEGIGFIFSKPMDHDSLRSGISFYPSIRGYFEEAGERAIIFFPEEEYRIGTEYRITMSQGVKDSLGLSLFEEERWYFSAFRDYLRVEKLTLDSAGESLPPGGVLWEHKLNPATPGALKVKIAFSAAIPPANRGAALESVSLSVLFPASTGSPVLGAAKWEDEGAVLSLSYENVSPSGNGIDNYYQIKIAAGKQGPLNGAGEYLEEELWYAFRIY
jgi:hypothetical protein